MFLSSTQSRFQQLVSFSSARGGIWLPHHYPGRLVPNGTIVASYKCHENPKTLEPRIVNVDRKAVVTVDKDFVFAAAHSIIYLCIKDEVLESKIREISQEAGQFLAPNWGISLATALCAFDQPTIKELISQQHLQAIMEVMETLRSQYLGVSVRPALRLAPSPSLYRAHLDCNALVLHQRLNDPKLSMVSVLFEGGLCLLAVVMTDPKQPSLKQLRKGLQVASWELSFVPKNSNQAYVPSRLLECGE